MDDRHFDSLTKTLANAKNRRSVLKGLLGLGSAALTGGALLDNETEAARRTPRVPKLPTCPGRQTLQSGVCACPSNAPNKCGPDCCTGKTSDPYPRPPEHTECCDNACCDGTCYGEELCCPTNNSGPESPPTHQVCEGPNGKECCPYDDQCCLIDGCCETVCYGGSVGASFCCTEESFCPGSGERGDLCCTGGTTCCGSGTEQNTCVDLTVAGNCCGDSDCGDPCQVCNPSTNTCGPRCNAETEVCCTGTAGPGECVTGECCVGLPGCGDDRICCAGPNGTSCEEGPYCGCDRDEDCPGCQHCIEGTCTEGCQDSAVCCAGPEPECCPAGRECAANGHCCGTNQFECNGVCVDVGTPCSDCVTTDDCGACEVCMNGNCAPCEAVGNICCNDICVDAQCCDAGDCLLEVDACVVAGVNICLCLDGFCVPGTGSTCTDSMDCGSGEVCCEGECVLAQCCTAADCVLDADICVVAGLNICLCVAGICEPQVTPECTVAGDCEGDDECVACQDGSCVAVNQAGSCNGGAGICDGVYCVNPPSDGCSPGCDGADECVDCVNAECVAINQGGSCNGGAGICSDVWCVECVTNDQCGTGEVCCDNVCFAGQCCFGDECLTVAAGLCATLDPLVNLCVCTEAHVCLLRS